MSKAERTRAFIIEKAAPVFNTRGYSGTSLTDIVSATQLTKGAIYGNFTCKNDIAIAVYQYNFESMRRRVAKAMAGSITAMERLKAYTGFYRENWKEVSDRGGCPVLNAATEADDNLTFMKAVVQASIKKWLQDISGIIQAGIDNGECRQGIDARTSALSLMMTLEGGMMFFKIMSDKQYLFHALDRMDMIIDNEIKK
jgi:AcrR family transcriptional regulator